MIRACVIGHPVSHSRSPLIHNHWIAEHRLDAVYTRQDVAPEGIASFLNLIREGAYRGCNVTLPHKEAVAQLVDRRGSEAEATGSVNTVYLEDGRLVGDSTDGWGYLAYLDATYPGWDGTAGSVLMIGAGGAARSIVHSLLGRGRGVDRIGVANRTRARSDELAARFGPRVQTVPWPVPAAALAGADLLINTTALGMEGQVSLDVAVDGLPGHAIVSDIVYVPLETPLLAAARGHGLRVLDGLGMLLYQAVPGFERWFGVRPTVTPALRAILEASIEGR